MNLHQHLIGLLVGGLMLIFCGCASRTNQPDTTQFLYGPSTSLGEVSLRDLKRHPIWLWSLTLGLPSENDGPLGGDETGMRAWLGPNNVTKDMTEPMILLRIKGNDHWAEGLYQQDKAMVVAICVHGEDGWRPPDWYLHRNEPVTYVSVPAIQGISNVEFKAKSPRTDEALRIP